MSVTEVNEGKLSPSQLRTCFDEQSLMLSSNCIAHFKHAILQAGRLRCRPVNSIGRRIGWYSSQIQNEVADLAIEDICGPET